jgi:hypothetical protein
VRGLIPYQLEHIFSYTGNLASPPEVIGPLPEGVRVNFYWTGGEVTGPKIHGKLRSGGGDWMTVRRDGVAYLDARSTIEMRDGALILLMYSGTGDLGENGYDKFLRGELPASAKLTTSPRLLTSHPEYLWLNRLHCLGIGEYRSASNAPRPTTFMRSDESIYPNKGPERDERCREDGEIRNLIARHRSFFHHAR